AVVVPARRAPRPLVPTRARWLAELAVTTLPQAPIEGMRLALEAHYLFAAAARSADSDDQLPAYGPLWVRTLLAASAWFEARAEQAMAVDLACWPPGWLTGSCRTRSPTVSWRRCCMTACPITGGC